MKKLKAFQNVCKLQIFYLKYNKLLSVLHYITKVIKKTIQYQREKGKKYNKELC